MKNFLVPLGGGNEIGASCYFYSICGINFVVDSGIRFSRDEPFPNFEILKELAPHLDAIFITHAHVDHCGSIHILSEMYPETPVFTTHETAQLLSLMVEDAIKVRYIREKDSQGEWREYKLLDGAISRIERRDFFDSVVIGDVEFRFFPAGHVLGAFSLGVFYGESSFLFHSGDFSIYPQRTVGSAVLPEERADLLVCESTYFYSRKSFNREKVEAELLQSIKTTVERGGKVLIPVFALGRAQEILLIISEGMRRGDIPPITVYVDGLAREVSVIYGNLLNEDFFNYYVQPAPVYQGLSFEEACEENLREADCILSTSGMLIEGTPSFVYGKLLSKSAKNAILFSGYMVEESFGYRLLNDRKLFRSYRCQIERHHLSAHSDKKGIENLVERLSPKKTIFVHGYPTKEVEKFHAFNLEVVRF